MKESVLNRRKTKKSVNQSVILRDLHGGVAKQQKAKAFVFIITAVSIYTWIQMD